LARDLYLSQALHVVQISSLSHVVNCPNWGCGKSHVSVKYGWNYLWEQFWA